MEKDKPDKIKDFLTYFLVERNNAGNEKWEQSLQRQNIVPHQSNDSYAVCFTKLALNSLLSLLYIFFDGFVEKYLFIQLCVEAN